MYSSVQDRLEISHCVRNDRWDLQISHFVRNDNISCGISVCNNEYMTGRTHDLAGFTALSLVVATVHQSPMTLGTAIVALSANMIGSLTPDIDQSTADLWRRLPAGSIFGKMLAPILGGHRSISHSVIGICLFALLSKALLNVMGTVVLVDMQVVWWAFMVGYVVHLLMDSLTHDGVPWLFPIPINFGFPPFKFMRFHTGKVVEKYVIFPGLILINIWIYYTFYDVFLTLLKSFVR